MQVDATLKGKQAFWETPRNLALVTSFLVAVSASLAGFVGFKIGQKEPAYPPPTQIIFQPGSIVVPAAK